MYFELILEKTPYDPNSYYKEIPNDTSNISEKYKLSYEEAMEIAELFMDKLNDACGSLLGPYEEDYLNNGQCKKLYAWLENNIEDIKKDRKIAKAMQVLMEYTKRATELGTGMVIEL